jgi:sugar/nucleoside kinase (ribokinase family)
MKSFDILIAGEINPDLVVSDPNLIVGFGQQETLVERASMTVGSSSAIFACGAARLGLKVGFIGICGDDIFGRFMLDAMSERGVNISPVIVDPSRQTGLSVILTREVDRAILTHLGSIADLRAGQVTDNLLKQARHLHVASYFLQTNLQPELPDLFRRAHALGLTTSLDTNWDPTGNWAGLNELLTLTDVFFPNENELRGITGENDFEKGIRQLGKLSRSVALKLGAQGGMAIQSDVIVRAPSIKADLVDTVGAGDSFDGGFLYGYLNNWDQLNSLKLACVCGGLSTEKAGGTNGQPTLEEALKHVEDLS